MSTKAPFLVLPVLVLCLPQLCDGESAPGARIVRARADVFAAADVVNGGVLKSVGVIDFTTVDTQDKVGEVHPSNAPLLDAPRIVINLSAIYETSSSHAILCSFFVR